MGLRTRVLTRRCGALGSMPACKEIKNRKARWREARWLSLPPDSELSGDSIRAGTPGSSGDQEPAETRPQSSPGNKAGEAEAPRVFLGPRPSWA